MLAWLSFMIILMLVSLLLVVFIPPEKLWVDANAPLNFFLFQEPKTTYPNQLVNRWIEKPWKSDGDRIPCRIEASDSSLYIIYSHGNAENLLTALPLMKLLSEKLAANVIYYDYSGYGLNKYDTYERSAAGINATLRAVYSYVLSLGVQPHNIYLMGYSLGTGCSTQLASEVGTALGGLILIAAYSSVLEMVKEIAGSKLGPSPALQLSGLFTERWNNVRIIGQVKVPILLLHGKYDELVPVRHAHRLQHANAKATLVETECGHTSFNWDEIVMHVIQWRSHH